MEEQGEVIGDPDQEKEDIGGAQCTTSGGSAVNDRRGGRDMGTAEKQDERQAGTRPVSRFTSPFHTTIHPH